MKQYIPINTIDEMFPELREDMRDVMGLLGFQTHQTTTDTLMGVKIKQQPIMTPAEIEEEKFYQDLNQYVEESYSMYGL